MNLKANNVKKAELKHYKQTSSIIFNPWFLKEIKKVSQGWVDGSVEKSPYFVNTMTWDIS